MSSLFYILKPQNATFRSLSYALLFKVVLNITKVIEKKTFPYSKQEKIGDYRRQTNHCDGENIYIEDQTSKRQMQEKQERIQR